MLSVYLLRQARAKFAGKVLVILLWICRLSSFCLFWLVGGFFFREESDSGASQSFFLPFFFFYDRSTHA